jgi:hypothetical protein
VKSYDWKTIAGLWKDLVRGLEGHTDTSGIGFGSFMENKVSGRKGETYVEDKVDEDLMPKSTSSVGGYFNYTKYSS